MLRVRAIGLLLLSYSIAHASPADTPVAKKLMKRAIDLTHMKVLFGYIPPRSDFSKNMASVIGGLGVARKEHRAVLIYSPDPELATRTITAAFALVRSGELHGCTVVAAVGEKNDSYIRPVVERTGATLHVLPSE
jgi:hypothetical protein